ncbi:diguanylate cyclase/phosphodiesterase with PAS/PAC sensor(s) [Halopseudomonas xinjiangensis]|uniref:cyclic-guanylate-specific phosphodiesterase n=1 Tax=Halopseudomonas xinjiangensis TaxID=487184 RepID=A0A1H1PRZ9_9GAMM|nr:EAL domain-containing protein [Halopseudomonas xinjiangensis]SDS13930.1 diguanylate cyclase/phosphodiesterase with PAS/PAC sensor(s) [Halopseudomonas xinjiangensis]
MVHTPGAFMADNSFYQDEAFRLLFHRLPMACMLVDHRSGRIIDLNRAFHQRFGWRPELIIGQPERDFPMWSDPQQRRRLHGGSAVGASEPLEMLLRGRDGTIKPSLVSMEYIDVGGVAARLYTVQGHAGSIGGPGLPALAQTDTALEQSQERLRLALDAAQMGIWDLDLGSGRLHASARAARLHGFPGADWEGTLAAFMEDTAPSDRRAMRKAFVAICRGGQQRYRLTYRLLRRSGEPRWLEAIATLNRNASGRPLGMVGTLVDITERRRSEQALIDSENKFASLFQGSPDPYALLNTQTHVFIEVNRSFAEVFGYRPEQIIGRTLSEIGLWSETALADRVHGVLATGESLHNETMDLCDAQRRSHICEVSSSLLTINRQRCVLFGFRDVTERKAIEAQVKHLAYHDALTDLPNRILLKDRLEQHIALYDRHQLKGALLFFDLDHFKHINDSLGHSCGDAVLQEVTRRLAGNVRREDTVARLGGDEFVVLLSGLEADDGSFADSVQTTAEKLRFVLSEPMIIEGHSLQLSTSIGVALIPDHGESPDDLLKRADIALYRVKEAGRNGVAFFEQSMQVTASKRLVVENQLRRALALGEFKVYYQPQFDSLSHRVVGAEALLRWEHPEQGLIGPASFIKVLEESGMIIEAGRWVLAEACQFFSRLRESGLVGFDNFSLSVNISPRQFRQSGFVDLVRDSIGSQDLPPGCIKLEITEGVVIENISDTVEKMQELRQLGVSFAIDDFGTGYSSLSYLKRLPLDLLKIDQSFVRDCASNGNDAEIVRAIVAIARSLKLDMIAEGVETEEQLTFLRGMACHCYQGYLFSPPLDETAFMDLLSRT